jgi:hypothetical protein
LINLLHHDAESAVIELGQRELLLLMALVKEGRDSNGCDASHGTLLDDFFISANVLVEKARREVLKTQTVGGMASKIVALPERTPLAVRG